MTHLIFVSKINSAGAVTLDLFVDIVKCLCSRQTCTSILKNVSTYHWKSFESVHGEERLKVRWVVKKSVFSFLNALISTKLHFCSKPIYFAINMYIVLISTSSASFENSTSTPGSFRENFRLNHRSPFSRRYKKNYTYVRV